MNGNAQGVPRWERSRTTPARIKGRRICNGPPSNPAELLLLATRASSLFFAAPARSRPESTGGELGLAGGLGCGCLPFGGAAVKHLAARLGARTARTTYEHHKESPDLEEGHGEAQHGGSGPWHQQGPNGDALHTPPHTFPSPPSSNLGCGSTANHFAQQAPLVTCWDLLGPQSPLSALGASTAVPCCMQATGNQKRSCV